MSCPRPIELSRALVVGIDDQLRAHLDGCLRCSAEVESHAAVVGETHYLPIVEPTHEHARGVRAALLASARTPAAVPRSRLVWGFATAGALAAAAVLAFVLVRPQPAPVVSHATVLPHAGAALMRVDSGSDETVRLAHGTLTVKVAKADRQRFRVVTGDAELDVQEAAFDVSVDRDHLSAVRVIYGRVEIRAQGAEPRVLSAGERWDIELARTEPVEDLVQIAEEADAPAISEPAKPIRKHKAPQRALSEKPAPPVSSPARPKRPIEVLFEEGWSTLAAGDAATAASIFERAAQAAPKDPLAEDAWFWRASALARAKSSSAAGALDAFLARYPSSPRVGEASAMLGWLTIDNDLDRAERLFNLAVKDRVAAVRASATKGLTAIAQRRER
jgi:TolA-binding protein